MPERIQMTRNKPWRDQHPDAVIVDRRTRWGNPFSVMDVGRTSRALPLTSVTHSPSISSSLIGGVLTRNIRVMP